MRVGYAALIIAGAIFVGFVFSIPRTTEVETSQEAPPITQEKFSTEIPVVSITDSYRRGVHTIKGSLVLPTPCTTLSAEARADTNASTTESITILLTAPTDSGVCLRLPERRAFSVSVEAPEGIPILVFVNEVAASTTAE